MAVFRGWRIFIVVALTVLLIVPLYRMRDSPAAASYKEYIYDHLSELVDGVGGYNNTLYHQGTEALVSPQSNFSTPCDNFPNTSGILLVMKTGATESYDKLPTQLLTHMQCLPDFLIFSDLEQQIGKHHVYDALSEVDPDVKSEKKEFGLYEAQRQCPISQKECTKDMGGGWDLDKYKFIHIIEKTWQMRPGMDWYVFAEADTYVFWDALSHFLRERAMPKDFLYVGSVAFISSFPFAHGGSGYVISGPLLEKIATIPDVTAKYDLRAMTECCGDLIVSLAADEAGAKVKQAHPMFNGEKPSTLPYGPGHWCEPIFTMHHMNPEEVSSVWQYEQTRTKTGFIQIRDMYHTFFAPHLTSRRDDWDNMAQDRCYIAPDEAAQQRAGQRERDRQLQDQDKTAVERRAHESPEACALVCEAAGLDIDQTELAAHGTTEDQSRLIMDKYGEKKEDDRFTKARECFQWRFHEGVCCTGKSFSLGAPKREKDPQKKWTSGWFVDGINDWIEAKGECHGPAWREPI